MPKLHAPPQNNESEKPANELNDSIEEATEEKSKSSSPKKRKSNKRAILYPEIEIRICLGSKGTALTDEQGKQLLGWREAPEGEEFLFKDEYGKGIQCLNNVNPDYTNRPLTWAQVETLKQEILTGNWEMNCENLIIGLTGMVLNGQHTLIALALACQCWEKDKAKYKSVWKTRPTIDKLIAFGCSESDKVVNTMDTCKPRTLWEVICRSHYFADLKLPERKLASRRLQDAVKMLWHRTGAFLDAFRPRRTHSESLHFIERHPSSMKAVRHIQDENGSDNRIGRYIIPGYAAALMYLMGTSATVREKEDKTGYTDVVEKGQDPSEKQLDLSEWDKASDFFTLIGDGHKSMDAIREALGHLFKDEGTQGGTNDERIALLCKAWNAYKEREEITEEDLVLQYETDGEGRRHLTECPVVEGIDLGNPQV